MAALSRPVLPAGPHRDLVDALHRAHHRAGRPSLRDLARDVAVSRTTVAAVFSDARVPRWGILELLVESLGADVETFRELWLAATGGEGPTFLSRQVDVPHQLAMAPTPFVGRTSELAAIDRVRDAAAAGLGSPVAVVCGAAGSGKSSLVLRWASLARATRPFADGELYLDLRGHDARAPMTSDTALTELLRAVGVDERAIPAGHLARAARWRTEVADKELLVVLDNAGDAEHLRDLLPGTSRCLVLATSRDSLPGIVARVGATRIELPRMSDGEAVDLLTRLVGDRAREEPAATRALATQCATLPIALRLAAERAATRPHQPLRELVAELERVADRLDLLDVGEHPDALRTVFSWSTGQLGRQQERAFALLGLLDGEWLDDAAVAALLGGTRLDARRTMEWLARLHLVEPGGDGWGMHDLMRAYARESLDREDPEVARTGAARLAEHYVARMRATPTDEWFVGQRVTVLAVAAMAAYLAPRAALAMSELLGPPLDAAGHYADALSLHTSALAAAHLVGAGTPAVLLRLSAVRRHRGELGVAAELAAQALEASTRIGDHDGSCAARVSLGIAYWRTGLYLDARDVLQGALDGYVAAGDHRGQGSALYNLGITLRRLGDYSAAAEHHRRAMAVAEAVGDEAGRSRALSNGGVVQLRLGRADEALAMFDAARQSLGALHDRAGEAVALTNTALALLALDRPADALDAVDRSLVICVGIGYRIGEGDARCARGAALVALDRLDESVAELRSAVAIGRELSEADVLVSALIELGSALVRTAHHEAGPVLDEAVRLADRSGDPEVQARALRALAVHADALGDTGSAARHRRRAAHLRATMHSPDHGSTRAPSPRARLSPTP